MSGLIPTGRFPERQTWWHDGLPRPATRAARSTPRQTFPRPQSRAASWCALTVSPHVLGRYETPLDVNSSAHARLLIGFLVSAGLILPRGMSDRHLEGVERL